MSGTFTPYGRQLLLGAVFTPELVTVPAELWVALTSVPPVANSDGTQLDEPDPLDGYLRVSYPLDGGSWDSTQLGELFNTGLISFDAPTDSWPLLTGWALCSADTAGDCYAVGTLLEPYAPTVGVAPYIDVGGIAVGLYD